MKEYNRAKDLFDSVEMFYNDSNNVMNNQIDIKEIDAEFKEISRKFNISFDDLIFKLYFKGGIK